MPQKGCISFDSYIKPQHEAEEQTENKVVYLLTPTSNHNSTAFLRAIEEVVYLLTPTSNHNNRPHVLRNSALYIF